MFHAISARLGRLPRRTRARLATPFEYAAWRGWQARQIGRGTWQFRDPRFGQRIADHLTAAGQVPARRTWAQTALTNRIRSLGAPSDPGTQTGRGA